MITEMAKAAHKEAILTSRSNHECTGKQEDVEHKELLLLPDKIRDLTWWKQC